MALEEKNGLQFVQYVQQVREAKDDYTKRKVQKDRHKLIKWITTILKEKEIILTFQHDGRMFTEFVTLMDPKDGRFLEEFPEAPLTKETIHGEEVEEDQYIRCYHIPTWDPMLIHVDEVICWFASQEGMDELHKNFERIMYD